MNVTGFAVQFFLIAVVSLTPAAITLLAVGASLPLVLTIIFISLLLATSAAAFFTNRLSSSLQRLERTTERLAQGELSAKVYPSRIPQLAGLANGLNSMASILKTRVETLTKLGAEQEAILRGMTEGVLTITRDGHIARINDAARTLLDVPVTDCSGRLVAEVVRHIALQRFISAALLSEDSLTEILVIHGPIERILQVYSSPLKAESVDLGVLIVLQDTTQLDRLERIRRDFVANVSHELRTPITAIKGYVETLLDGAKDDPATLVKFLRVMERQVERLQNIFTDLLALSQLEARGDAARADVVMTEARSIVQAALDSLQPKFDQKEVEAVIEAPDSTSLYANPRLLQQALTNLLDNAVTYSGEKSRVVIAISATASAVTFSVTDNGPGIAKVHLPRLFERFYRVDTGRSRDMGGTGLGLAIVKHIAQVHGGTVTVNSTPGIGTSFLLAIPKEAPNLKTLTRS
jgi:two-component system phosphate regulon sensor histidine kinase PhoR